MARDRRSSAIVMVHDYPPLTGGGLALGVRELADLLSVDHDVCVLSSRWRDHFADDRRVRGAPGADAGTAVARAGVGHAVRRFFDADIIITHWTFSVRRLATAGIFLGPLLGKPTVCVIHTAPAHCRYNRMRYLPAWARRALLTVVGRAMRRCAAVVALNDDHAAAVRAAGLPVTHVVPLMLSDVPAGLEVGRGATRGVHRQTVGIAGELSVLKGADRLPAIVRELAPDFGFRIAGTGPLERRLRVELSADVEMLGWVSPERMADFYRSIDCLLVVSRSEAQSRVTLEAMLAGPIVATAADCGMAWLVEDGVTGVLIDADDPRAVRARLTSLASDAVASAAMRQRARDFAAALLDESRSGWRHLTPLETSMRVEQVR